MERLNITSGEWKQERSKKGNKLFILGVCTIDVPEDECSARGCCNSYSDAELICDAGTTYNKCNLLPSQLLESLKITEIELKHKSTLMESCEIALEERDTKNSQLLERNKELLECLEAITNTFLNGFALSKEDFTQAEQLIQAHSKDESNINP